MEKLSTENVYLYGTSRPKPAPQFTFVPVTSVVALFVLFFKKRETHLEKYSGKCLRPRELWSLFTVTASESLIFLGSQQQVFLQLQVSKHPCKRDNPRYTSWTQISYYFLPKVGKPYFDVFEQCLHVSHVTEMSCIQGQMYFYHLQFVLFLNILLKKQIYPAKWLQVKNESF